MSFVNQDILARLNELSRDRADSEPYGIVKVDNVGKVLLYNRYESELAGVPASSAEGKNFFTEIAPCTNNKLFAGRLKAGAESGSLDATFNYTFTYKMRPTNVSVHLFHDRRSRTNWIFIAKKAA